MASINLFAGVYIVLATFASNSDKVDDYNSKIIQANRAVYSCNLSLALEHYKAAFSIENVQPFYHDLKNCVVIAYECKDSDLMKECLDRLVDQKQLGQNDFSREFPFFNAKIVDYLEKKISERVEKSNRQIYYKTRLLKLYKLDQEVHQLLLGQSEEGIRERNSADSTNFIEFSRLMDVRQFQGENDIGAFLSEMNIWNIYGILFRHFVQIGFGEDLLAILHDYHIVKDKIPAEIYANIIDLKDNIEKRLPTVQNNYINIIGASYHRPMIKYDSVSMNALNSKRLSMGIDSFHVSFKQAVTQTFCQEGIASRFKFSPFSYVEHLPSFLFNSDEDQKYLKSLEIDLDSTLPSCLCEKW